MPIVRKQYVPYDYRRCCDICGNWMNISQMTERVGHVFVCDNHPGEKTELELSLAIQATEPIVILPVPDPKPLDLHKPNTFAADDGATFNFVTTMMNAPARYMDVTGYGAGAVLTGSPIPALGWAGRYYYEFIQWGKGAAPLVAQAKLNLAVAAKTLINSYQTGFGLSPSSTQTNSAFWGGFLDGSLYTSDDVAAAGLCLLYNYRINGTNASIVGARAAASFLRNVQAIGSCGTNFTSGDSGGTARLYTGAVASQVSSASGFFCDHRFYPSGLLTLEFWNELKTTDGDQTIGTTGTPTGLTLATAQLLSQSITDMRSFWTNGVFDVTANKTIAGFTKATPFEDFNAYPASKPNFSVTGTGSWEYQDGAEGVGTSVSGLNWASGLGSLFAFEGYSSQVSQIDGYLRSFASNVVFQTPTADLVGVSDATLAASSTGTYLPTQGIATLLQVAGAGSPQNGSTLYDWGAFGRMVRLYAAQHSSDLYTARPNILGLTQRFNYGIPARDSVFDRIALRGRSGLSFQTSFTETIQSASRRVEDAVAASQWATAYRV